MTWRHSTRCEAGACLEANGPWTKSTYSSESFNCVQARQDGTVLVRDSKLGDRSPVLEFEAGVWVEFVDWLKGEGS